MHWCSDRNFTKMGGGGVEEENDDRKKSLLIDTLNTYVHTKSNKYATHSLIKAGCNSCRPTTHSIPGSTNVF